MWTKNQRSGKQLCNMYYFLWRSLKAIPLVWDVISIIGSSNKQEQQAQNQYEVGKSDTGTHAAATGMKYTPSIRELGYLNKKSLLRLKYLGSN